MSLLWTKILALIVLFAHRYVLTFLEEGKKCSINEKKASAKELQDYFTKVLPEWDRDRVQNSHIKKLITWYNILIENGITDFKDAETEEKENPAE